MPEQITYANILFLGAWGGIAVMILTYFVYVTGIMDPHVPLETVVANWHLGVQDYLKAVDGPTGWGWAAMLNTGDYLNYLGIALLSVLTIICYLVLLPGFWRNKDWLFVFIVIAEVVVLSVAASGVLGTGGH
jgi:hypothetical protein